jgi:hypothetical protein
LKKIIFYRKLKNRLFQICVKKVSFLLMLFVLGILCTFALASHIYTGKYLMTEGAVSIDSLNNSEIRITVEADLVPDIVNENNIKWYVSADNVRRKAVIKEIHFDGEGGCDLVLQPKDNDKYKIEPVKKVYVIIMYGRNYVF